MLNISKKMENNVLTISLEGRLDTPSAIQFEESLMESIGEAEELVLDFEKLDYIASSGLRVLFVAQEKMSEKGGMKIIHVPDIVMEVFEVTNFVDVLTIE